MGHDHDPIGESAEVRLGSGEILKVANALRAPVSSFKEEQRSTTLTGMRLGDEPRQIDGCSRLEAGWTDPHR
jgi:hypothetical protein